MALGPSSTDEEAPVQKSTSEIVKGMALMVFFGGLYIATSSALIGFNKYLMTEDRFPYAINLVLLHAISCSLFCGVLLLIKPSFFPSLTDPEKKVSLDFDLIFKGCVPVAALFCGQLVLSNTAYLHSSVAFLQMMKEANLVLVYVFSLIVGLEKFSGQHVQVLFGVCVATALTIHGELNFSWTGFAIQGTSQLFEATKLVLQAVLLCGARKLDPLTYCLLVMPLCALFHGIFLGVVTMIPHTLIKTATWGQLWTWSPYLLANCCVAISLNIVIALFIKHSAAVSFILAGIMKDAMIVSVGAFFFREIVSALQVFGFTLQVFFIFIYGLLKSFPRDYEDAGLFMGTFRVLCGYRKPIEDDQNRAVVKDVASSYGAAGNAKKAIV